MDKPKLTAAILIISDTAFQDPATDRAYDTLSDVFANEGNSLWTVRDRKIVPDDVLSIQKEVSLSCDGADFVNLLVTTGGTGFAVKDSTPEAIGPLIHKHAPGLVHGMLAASLEVTPFALMSRPVAGVRNKTLIITLPGSPKGAKENLQALLKLLPHACLQAAGGDSRILHAGGVKKLEEEAGVSSNSSGNGGREPKHKHHVHNHGHTHAHDHSHGGHAIPKAHTRPEDRPVSNDPRAGPSSRYRESPYPMLSVEEAVKTILEHSPHPRSVKMPVNGSLIGHVLAEDVQAGEAVPAYRASIVDGYAVFVSEDGPSIKGVFPVAAVSHAQPGDTPSLYGGQVARITTGAPLPPGANSVVMVEDTVIRSMTDDGREEKEIEILTDQVKPDENIREIGSDIQAGEVVLRKGEEITAVGGELGLLASVGKADVMVYKKPIVGVLSTGDEIVLHDRPGPLRRGEVRDCNRPTLMAAIQGWGFQVVDLGIAKDTPGALESDLRLAFRTVDVIVTSGGVSMGELDLLKPTIERSLGGTVHFGRVSMKPGKPSTFATVILKDASTSSSSSSFTANGDPITRPIFSLPGNPASALVTAHLFVLPSLQYSSGQIKKTYGLPRVKVVLDKAGGDVVCDPKRPEYHRVVITTSTTTAAAAEAGTNDHTAGLLRAVSTGPQRSSRVSSLRGANGLLCLPAEERTVRAGEVVDALIMGPVVGGGV